MYRGRDEYQNGIIVEVQRLHGFDLSYIQDVYAILDAAAEAQTPHEESRTVAEFKVGCHEIFDVWNLGSPSTIQDVNSILGAAKKARHEEPSTVVKSESRVSKRPSFSFARSD